MKADYKQIIIDLAKAEFRDWRNPNRMDSMDTADLIDIAEIKETERKNDRLNAEIMSLREEIKMRENRLESLEKQLNESNISKKKIIFTKTVERIKQELQTIEGLAKYLPDLKPGRKRRHETEYDDSYYSGIDKKTRRNILLVEELKRRKAKNPERPVTCRTFPDETHANDLAKELRDAGKKRLGYETIRRAWDNRDKN